MSQIQIYNVSAGGGGPILTLSGNSGGAVPPTAGNINIVGGAGVTVTGNPGTSTLTINVSGEFKWIVTTVGLTAVSNMGYITNSGALVAIILPALSAVGDVIRIAGLGAGGWTLQQQAGQVVHCMSRDTTVGAGGSLSSMTAHDTLEIVCAVANTEWIDISQNGNLAVV